MENKNIHVLSRAVVVDKEHILLCKMLDLAESFYFLPGGHVEPGESLKTTLLRELKEESGAEGSIVRFLGCLEYSFEPGHSSICHNHEYNFLFQTVSPALKVNKPIASLEKHIELLWFPMDELLEIDFRPEPLRELLPEWLGSNVHQDVLKSEMV